jgi:hypothetical protein
VSNEVGRPPVLDAAKKRDICAILAMGGTRVTAARFVCCHPDTIRNTALRDEEFAQALEQAESKHEVAQLAYINNAGKDHRFWRAAAWALEHRYPRRYGRGTGSLYTLEQVIHVLTQFAGVILDEISDRQQRQQILARLETLTAELHAVADGENE